MIGDSDMASTSNDLSLTSVAASGRYHQGLTTYLNEAVALYPPLRVEGQPPLLRIYLPTEHLYKIAGILRQIEAALTALRGPKYWEVFVYSDSSPVRNDGVLPHRLIYHTLLELTQAPSALSSQAVHLPNFKAATSTVTPTVIEPMRPAMRRKIAARRKATFRKRRIAGAITVGFVSFGIGSFTALVANLGQRWQSPVRSDQSIPAVVSTVPPEQLEGSPESLSTDSSRSRSQSSPEQLPETPPLTENPPEEVRLQPITAANGLSAAANVLTVPPAIQPAVKLKAVGDIIPGTNFPDYRIPDPNYLFNSVQMFMGEVDILFGNFESTLTTYPYSAKDISQGMTFAFRTPPEFAAVLREAGFDVLSVANNHSFDFGMPGFDDTIAHIEQAGIQAVGRKNQIVTVEANGYVVAFIGFSYWDDHNNMNDLTASAELVRAAQAQADMVVISVHAGAEGTDALRVRNQTEYFFSENRGNMVQFSRTMIDAGADLILGHGPHVPRAIELYQNKLIAYSLGNFLGYRTLSTVGPLGQSLILQVELNPEGDFLRGRVIPVALDPNGVPYIDNFFESVTLVRQLTVQDFPNTPLQIDQMGYILRTD